MTGEKKKVVLAAVAHYLEEERSQEQKQKKSSNWSQMGRKQIMKTRAFVQSRGKHNLNI
ncbi:MAG: hypothetical protein N4A49_15590 [Marinifilaceae bacterium]|jgi:hypothetical protein|nr:hypothetical protein [Marinifilaceae bacterium]